MFKKKVNKYEVEPVPNKEPPKSFLLSPKAQPPAQVPQIPKQVEYQAAEVVSPPMAKKMVKRVDSSTYESSIPELPKKAEEKVTRKFRRSDFIVGKKLGKGQFGEVMMVIHKDTGFLCAMKVMSKKQIR